MTVFVYEVKRGLKPLLIWAIVIAGMMLLTMIMFPQMKNDINQVNNIFSDMGGFTKAFGLDKLNFATAIGFYGTESGQMMLLGGSFYAAILGIAVIAKEESGHTAEFLLSHPISRKRVMTEKYLAMFVLIMVLNIICILTGIASFKMISETIPWKEFLLLHLGMLIMQIEVMSICFGISAFLRTSFVGIGIGLAVVLYFMNIIANISEKAEFLSYITPFGYCDPAYIIPEGMLESGKIGIGIAVSILFMAAGFVKYLKKDIAS